MELVEILQALSRASGPTGREEEAVSAAQVLLEPLVASTQIDKVGNLIGFLPSFKPEAKRIVLDAHLDEVCLVVTGWEDGFLQVASAFSGVDPRLLPASRVLVCARQPVYGVVTCLPPHLLSEEERETPFPMEKMRIDCGLTQEQAQTLVPVGTRVIAATEPFYLGQKKFCGKALDDRAGFAVILRVLQLLQGKQLDVDLAVVGSVQEESTELGAQAAGFHLAPQEAIVIDATFGDTPDSERDTTFPLGAGPTIGIGPALSRQMTRNLQAIAAREGIGYQDEVMEGSTGTNSMAFQIAREGVACAVISFPLRYMHTPREVVHLDDLENAARLIAAYLLEAGKEASHG